MQSLLFSFALIISLVKRFFFILLVLFFVVDNCSAQPISFKDTIAAYNYRKATINRTGMKVLTGWGAACFAGGLAGTFTATNPETKYFCEMTAAWGAINTGIGLITLANVRKELAAKLNAEQSYRSYKDNTRLYLINAGLDVVYIGAGIGLNAYGQSTKNNAPLYQGFGKAVVMQGVFLLLFDNVIYSAHRLDNSKWFRIMNEIRFSGSTVGIVHPF